MNTDKKDIKNFTLEELEDIISGFNEPSYRASQIFSWLYRKKARNFKTMRNLPKGLIERLDENYYIGGLILEKHLGSKETEKFLFRLSDGNFTETVLICSKERKTVCLSTQVGCKFACSFCASGRMGFVRDLSPSEIVGQILYLRHSLKQRLTNYVFMGMGEPLDNFENTSKAIFIMNDKEGLDIGARRITISTCGVIYGINRLKDLGLQINLSVSLHATEDKLRDELIPINKRFPLEELIKACRQYVEKAGRLITLEYVLIKGKNDSAQDADRLAKIAGKLKAKVNLITYSTVPGTAYQAPSAKDTALFMERLKGNRTVVTLRKSKGSGIQAACGQLAGKRNAEI